MAESHLRTMPAHKTSYAIAYHRILCHDMLYVMTIAASLVWLYMHPSSLHCTTWKLLIMHTVTLNKWIDSKRKQAVEKNIVVNVIALYL